MSTDSTIGVLGAELVARGWRRRGANTWRSPGIKGERYVAVAHSPADGGGISISRDEGWRHVLAWYIPSAQVREDNVLDEFLRAGVFTSARRLAVAS